RPAHARGRPGRGTLEYQFSIDGALGNCDNRSCASRNEDEELGTRDHEHIVWCGLTYSESRFVQCAVPVAGRMVENAGTEVARNGITVHVVIPGRISTIRVRSLDEAKVKRENRSLESVVNDRTATIPIYRYGTQQEK